MKPGGEFGQFEGRRYLNLETYRKNGEGVRTPVWFVEEHATLYVRTPARSGKVKRLRNDPRIRLVPCGRRGGPQGEWVEGEARLVGGAQAERANRLLGKKYGLRKRLGDIGYALKWGEAAVVEIRPRHEARGPDGRIAGRA